MHNASFDSFKVLIDVYFFRKNLDITVHLVNAAPKNELIFTPNVTKEARLSSVQRILNICQP